MPGGLELIPELFGTGNKPRLPLMIYSRYQAFRDDFITWVAHRYLLKDTTVEPAHTQLREVLGVAREEIERYGCLPFDRPANSLI